MNCPFEREKPFSQRSSPQKAVAEDTGRARFWKTSAIPGEGGQSYLSHHTLVMCRCLFGIEYMKLPPSFILFFTCMTESTFRFCIIGAASVGRSVSLEEKDFSKIICQDNKYQQAAKQAGLKTETYASRKHANCLHKNRFLRRLCRVRMWIGHLRAALWEPFFGASLYDPSF